MWRISGDPTLDAVIYIIAAFLVVGLAIASAAIAIPIIVAFIVIKITVYYMTIPRPTAELMAATQRVTGLANFPQSEAYEKGFTDRLLEHWGDDLPIKPAMRAIVRIARELYDQEDLVNPLPPIVTPIQNTIDEGRYRDALLDRMRKTSEPQKTLDAIQKAVTGFAQKVHAALPAMARTNRDSYHNDYEPLGYLPLVSVVPNLAELAEDIYRQFMTPELKSLGLFKKLAAQLADNLERASGKPGQQLLPRDFKGDDAALVATYFHNTPFEQLFSIQVPFELTRRQRAEHHAIYAPPGWGKTQTLERIIIHDLEEEDPPSIVVLDSQGDVDGTLRQLQKLRVFAPGERLADRLIIIDPEQYTPALNLFDMQTERLAAYGAADREAVQIGIQDLFSYLFEAMGADLTPRQATSFSSAGRLMMQMPNASLTTLRELMLLEPKDLPGSKFAQPLDKLDQTTRDFFQHQFFSKSLQQTRNAIANRLFAISRYPAFDRMFSAPRNKVDFFKATQEGKIILCNTSRRLLGEGASLFGVWVIAQCLRAAYERAVIPRESRRFTTLVIDEAVDYFATGAERMQLLLSQARKYQLGVCFATQYLDQMTPNMRSAAATVAIKMAGGVNDKDARSLAPDMRCESSFITSMRMKPMAGAEFATYVRNYTDRAVRLGIPFGMLADAPKMSDEEEREVVKSNAERYGYEPQAPSTPASGAKIEDPAEDLFEEAPPSEPPPAAQTGEWPLRGKMEK
jgi:hypothetical protein